VYYFKGVGRFDLKGPLSGRLKMKYDRLFLRAFGVWFMVVTLFLDAVVLPVAMYFSQYGLDFPDLFMFTWIAVCIAVSILIAWMIVAPISDTHAELARYWQLRALTDAGRKLLWYMNPIGVLWAFFYLFAWKQVLRPWFALMGHVPRQMNPPPPR